MNQQTTSTRDLATQAPRAKLLQWILKNETDRKALQRSTAHPRLPPTCRQTEV